MKKQHILTLAACAFFIGSPFSQLSAQETAPATPAPAVSETPAAPKPEEKAKPAMDPDKEKFAAVKKQASDDPKIKAANDAATEAKRLATLKMYAKMREIDPSLGPAIEKEEAKLKAKEPKPAMKPAVKPADKTAATKPADKPAADKKPAAAVPAKDKTAAATATPAKDKTAKPDATTKPATP